MVDSKTYLNVPYAEKDQAKALGARWDPASKKWYAPGNKDIALFVKWQPDNTLTATPAAKANPRNSAVAAGETADSDTPSLITQPTVTNFIAYDGDEPPWD